jgi:hypothetical protein
MRLLGGVPTVAAVAQGRGRAFSRDHRFVATQGTPIALRMPMHRLNLNPVLIAALVIVPVVGLAAWAWLARARVEADLRSFAGFEGMHFES